MYHFHSEYLCPDREAISVFLHEISNRFNDFVRHCSFRGLEHPEQLNSIVAV